MRLFVTDSPKPFLLRRTILLQGKEEFCFDLKEVLSCAGLSRPLLGSGTDGSIPGFLSLLCSRQPEAREKIEQALSFLAKGLQEKEKPIHAYDPQALALRKPIESGSKVIIVGHRNPISRTQGGTTGKGGTGFAKYASALADPEAKVRLPRSGGIFDADAVVGVVIGKRAERIPVSESLSCVAGFTLLIDVTDRQAFEEESRTNNSLLGKNRADLSPLGPSIWVAADGSFDQMAEVKLRLNGQVRQQFTLGDLAYGVEEMISAWSRLILEPGDILGLGATITRPAPGKTMESPIRIKPGDLLEAESYTLDLLKVNVVESEE